MMLVRKVAVWGIVAGLVAAIAACTDSRGDAESPVPEGMARLRVSVGGAPEGVEPRVLVTGGGESWPLSRSEVLDVEPGRYTVRIDPVRGTGDVRYGAQDSWQLDAVQGRSIEVDARYRVAIPHATKIVSDSARSTIISVAGDEVTLAAGDYAERLRPGDAIVAASGPRTPGGLSRRVTGLRRSEGRVVATTQRISLHQAMPLGYLTIRTESGERLDSDVTIEGKVPIGGFEAKTSVTLHEFQPRFDADLAWNVNDDEEAVAWLRTDVDYDITSAFDLPFKGERDLLKDEVALGGRIADKICGGAMGRIVIKIAKVGLVKPECELKGRYELRASVQGGFSASFQHRGTKSITIGKGAPPRPRWEPARDFDFETISEGSLQAAGGIELEVGVGDLLEFSELHVGLTMEWGTEAKLASGKLEAQPFVRFASNLSGTVLWGLDGEIGLAQKTYPLQPKITRAVGEGELDRREYGYDLTELKAALPNGSDLGHGLVRRTESIFINPYCPEEWPDPGCPFARPGSTAWATFVRGDGPDAQVLWVQARALGSREDAAALVEWTQDQREQWLGPFKLPTERLKNGATVDRSGAGTLAPADLGAWHGHQLQRSMITKWGGRASGGGSAVERYLVLSHHNVVIQVGAVGRGLLASQLSPGTLPGDLARDHQRLAKLFLDTLGEPG